MNKFAPIALVATGALFASVPAVAFAAETSQSVQAVTDEVASVDVNAGSTLYSAEGRRVGKVYRVDSEGNPQLIINARLVTVPASTLSEVDGKLVTTLSRRDVANAK